MLLLISTEMVFHSKSDTVTQQKVIVGIGIKTSIEIDMMLKNMLDIQILLSILFECILFY